MGYWLRTLGAFIFCDDAEHASLLPSAVNDDTDIAQTPVESILFEERR
jgi:hypothetical protein